MSYATYGKMTQNYFNNIDPIGMTPKEYENATGKSGRDFRFHYEDANGKIIPMMGTCDYRPNREHFVVGFDGKIKSRGGGSC